MHEAIRAAKTSNEWHTREIEHLLVDGTIYNEELLSLALRDNFHKRLCNCLKMLFGKRNLTMVEVGVNQGKTISYLCKNRDNMDIFAIEPNADVIPDLKDRFSKNVKIFNHGLGDKNGEGILHITKSPRNSSQFMPNPEFNNLGRVNINKKEVNEFEVVKKMPFQIITGDNFVEDKKIDSVDLLSLNTQGSEFLILKGFLNSLKSGIVKSILLENDLDNRYLGVNDDFVDQQVLLKNNGFVLFDILLIRNLGPAGIRRLYPFYVHESINIKRGY